MKSVLFVCLGNICRSPTGEGVLKAFLDRNGLSNTQIDSAGTIGFHEDKPADSRMRQAASHRGYRLDSRSRKITPNDLETFDLVIAMDGSNFQDIHSISANPSATVKLLSEFLNEDWPADVPDPYYGGAEGFEYVLDMVEAACPAIIEYLQSDP